MSINNVQTQRNSLILSRNSQASNPLFERLPIKPYDVFQKKVIINTI